MPADTTMGQRRAARQQVAGDGGPDIAKLRGVEAKRTRGEIACAECRRLKLKCDRKLPCSSCKRRGCSTICPNGVLTGGQGSRYILADTERLHRKLIEMSERIRQLEDGLAILHRMISNNPAMTHPLLKEGLMNIKNGIEEAVPEQEQEVAEEEVIEAFGSLTIERNGVSSFHGFSGGLETLFRQYNRKEGDSFSEEDSSPDSRHWEQDMNQASSAWPFSSPFLPGMDILINLRSRLPPWERALELIDVFYRGIGWYCRPIQRDQVMDEILPTFYPDKTSYPPSVIPSEFCEMGRDNPHFLALLFSILSVGAISGSSISGDDAEEYFQNARASMALKSVFEHPGLACVQATALMSVYLVSTSRAKTVDTPWLMMKFATNLAINIGLHRDASRFNLEPRIVDRRRRVFWELFAIDHWQSLGTGRPATFSLHVIDCQFPEDKEQQLDDDGNILESFWAWKFRFAKEVLSHITLKLSSATYPKYSDILELDRIIREHKAPSKFKPGASGVPHAVDLVMPHFLLNSYRDIILLFIHRSFFTKAMLDHPTYPLKSPYAASCLASYRSATFLLKSLRDHYEWFPSLLSRFYGIWTQSLISMVIVASIVIRGPGNFLAPTAFAELNLAIDLFEKAATNVPVARRAMPIVKELKRKAHDAYTRHQSGQTKPDAAYDEADELAIISGLSQVTAKSHSTPPTSHHTSQTDLLKYLSLERNGVPSGFTPQTQPAIPSVADEEFWVSLGQHLYSSTNPELFAFDTNMQDVQNFGPMNIPIVDTTTSSIQSAQNVANNELLTGTRDTWLAFMEDSGLTQFGVL